MAHNSRLTFSAKVTLKRFIDNAKGAGVPLNWLYNSRPMFTRHVVSHWEKKFAEDPDVLYREFIRYCIDVSESNKLTVLNYANESGVIAARNLFHQSRDELTNMNISMGYIYNAPKEKSKKSKNRAMKMLCEAERINAETGTKSGTRIVAKQNNIHPSHLYKQNSRLHVLETKRSRAQKKEEALVFAVSDWQDIQKKLFENGLDFTDGRLSVVNNLYQKCI